MAPRNLEDVYPLSPLQEGILFHSLYAPESGVYVEQLSCALAGPLDAAAFARAWERVIERHAVLRTAFVWKSQKRPLQAVERAVALPLFHEDWSHLAAGEREARFAAFLAEDRERGFAAARAPLLRIALLRFGASEHRLVWTFHHLLLDGWSLPLVLSEVLLFYAAFAAGRELTLRAPRPYRDYITWVERQDLAAAEAFFRRALEGFTEPTEVDVPRPMAAERQRRDPDDRKLTLGSERHARLAELARRHRLTLNTLLLGAWASLLGRYAGEGGNADDVVFGTTVSGRSIPLAGIESMIGLFINTLPVRARLDPRAEVGAWLAGLQESQLAREAFETTPLPRIQDWSELPPGTPLVASLFVFENYPQLVMPENGSLALGEVRFRERTNYPLTAIAVPAGEDLELRLAWDPERHDAATAARLLAHWARLLAALGEALGAAPGSAGPRLGDLPMLSEAERQQMVVEWNPSPPAEPAELAGFLLHERFAAQAARTPDAVALTAPPGEREGGGELTYGELAGRAGRLAAVLRRRGVGAESLVAICLERSLDLVVALLAVLEAGGAYLPLDPTYPPERLGFMVDDSGARVLVSRPALAARLPLHGAQLVAADEGEGGAEDAMEATAPLRSRIGSDSGSDRLAYVIYTSGSTGRPKGVPVTHGDVLRLLAATRPLFGFGPDDVWTLLHSYAFDFSVWEIWGALAHGGRLVVVPYVVSRAPEELLRLLATQQVTVLNQTPGAFAQLAPAVLAGDGLPDLRLVIFGGEALDPAVLAGWLRRFGELRPQLVNMYGITETTVHATWRPLGRADLAMSASPASPIGRPLAHLEVHLLDRHGRLVPSGVSGEMHVGGTALARGYLGRPELAAERFLPDGVGGGGGRGARLYKTGDLARWRPDGELEFLGRADRQVKIRGHRVELGEVEAALAACPGVRAAAVVARERDGVRRLVAYVAAPAERTAADLRARLSRTLPEPMLPAAIVRLEALPLTPNGKVDLRALAALAALPALDAAEDAAAARAGAGDTGRIAPRGPVEELLAGLWAEVLRLPEVGVHDNFFALGGDSILSLQVVARAGQAGCRITPRQLFEHPTIAGLAALIEQNIEQNTQPTAESPGAREEDEAAGEVPLTPIQRWFLDREPADPHHFNQALLLAVRRPPPAPPAALTRAIAALVAHHDALRLRFRREEGRWRQRRLAPQPEAPPASPEMVRIDLSRLAEERARTAVTAAAAAAQQSLDLAAGPLLRALWLDLPAGAARLFLAVHHLAVDGVSWRILLDDLATAWRQIGRGERARLPPRTASFRRWAERLAGEARTMAAEPEIAFWLAQTAPAPGALLAPPEADAQNTVATAALVAVELGLEDTADLLRVLPAAYGASIADALVAALAATLAEMLAGPGGAVYIDLEGHGREEVSGDRGGDLDLSRSVGWFTSLYPVRLVPGDDPRPEAVLAAVRRQLAAVPGRGVGYGLLRYLSEHPVAAVLRDRPPSPVSFNYLGQLDAALPADSPFAAAGEPVGPSQSPRAALSHALAVAAFIAAGRLEVTWTYGAQRLAEEVVRRLAERFLARLRELAAGARSRVLTLAPIPAPIPADDLARLPADVEDVYPLSPLQEGLLFHSLYAPGSGAYVEQLHATFEGDLDLAAFREAWRRIVAGTPVLRTSFHGEDLPRPLQAVHRRAAAEIIEIVEEDWRPLEEPERQLRFAALVRADRLRGFDLARPPLLRWTLVRTGEHAWRFLWSHHHALLDGWSFAALIGDFAACYEALAAGREPSLRARPPYRDFIAWLSRRDPAADDDFFRAYLAGFGTSSTAPTPLAADRPAPALGTAPDPANPADPAITELRLAAAETAALQAAVRARGLTLNTLAQGAWALLLGRASGERDVVFGTTVSGRPPELPGVEAMLGLFINTLPARVRLPDEAPVSSWLVGLQAAQAELRQHEAAPLVRIQEVSPVARGTALFDSVLVFENYPQAAIRASALGRRITEVLVIEQTHYPLTLNVVPAGDRLLLSLGYDRARFDATTVERRLGHLKGLLATLASSLVSGLAGLGEERLAAIGLPLSAAERQQLLREWSDAAPVAGVTTPVHELFAAQAARRPDAVALVAGHQVLTYGELARRSSRMARRLAELGVGPGMLVGLCAERSPELILGVLAILAAGGAYLPLDPAHPMERLAYTLADAGAPILLAAKHLHERLPAGAARVVGLHALVGCQKAAGEVPPRAARADPGDLAYVIYTSGSTGRPKGVEVSHANAARLFAVLHQAFAFGSDDIWTLFHSIAFDFSVWELWGALAFGGRLVVVPSETARSTEAFYELLRRERVTVLSQTPSAFRQLLWAEESALARGEAMASDLRLVVFGGEALDLPALAPWLERHGEERPLLVNMYGITETTVHTTWRRLRQSDLSRPGSAVGRPLSDLALHLLDGGGRPVPIGVPGEIHVGGAGVARGYLARPALTAERFVPDPFAGGNVGGLRLYRSGDLARWRVDGDLEYLGRIDRQVKVRGFRIELGEIEAALAEHPGVREAAVVAREDRPGDVRLVGYVSSTAAGAQPDPSPQALAAFLAERLPGYMVPAAWVLLDRLPLTPNGKVDRAGLPAPEERGSGGAYLAPQSPVEQVLAAIWEEVLERQRVGVEDDFFALGGHSLVAGQVTSRVLKAFAVDLPLRALFERPTVAALAVEVERLRGSGATAGAPPLVRAPRGTEAPLSFSQERLWFFDQLSPDKALYNVPLALALRGALSVPALAAALAAEVDRHEALRTRFVSVGGRALQRVDPPWRPPLPLVDLRGLPSAVSGREMEHLTVVERTLPFDLARGPLLRAVLLRRAEEAFVLLLTFHHIMSDGWSVGVLAREMTALYGAALAGLPSPLPELPLQFRDFAIWQRAWLQGEALERLLGAAVARLAGVPRLDLPLDRPPEAGRNWIGVSGASSSRSGNLQLELDVAKTTSLSALSRRHGASLFMTLLAAFTGLLRRHTGRGDFAVVAAAAGRIRADLEPLFGYFTNTLALRAAATGDPDFGELLARTRRATLAAYDHQDLPFTYLAEALRAERPGEPPLFDVFFLWQPPMPAIVVPSALAAPFPVEVTEGGSSFALALDLAEDRGRVTGSFSYDRELFDLTTALRWRGHLEALLAGAVADPARPLTELPLLSAGERHQVTFEWGEAVHVDGGPAPIGIWGELAGTPAGHRARRLADGTLEVSAPAPAGLAAPAEAAPAFAAPAPIAPTASRGPGEPVRSLDSLSPVKRKLLAKRIRGTKALPEPPE